MMPLSNSSDENVHVGYSCPCHPALWDSSGCLSSFVPYPCSISHLKSFFTGLHALAVMTLSKRGLLPCTLTWDESWMSEPLLCHLPALQSVYRSSLCKKARCLMNAACLVQVPD